MNQGYGQPPGGRTRKGDLPTVYAPGVRPEHEDTGRISPLRLIVLSALVLLIIFVFGGYFLDWTWTGFHNNTLWDWLQLLVLPVTLTGATIWFGAHPQWRREWTVIAVIISCVFLVLVFGGYFLGWTWTGFHNNTLWDWLKLLLLPVVLTMATVSYTIRQHQHGQG